MLNSKKSIIFLIVLIVAIYVSLVFFCLGMTLIPIVFIMIIGLSLLMFRLFRLYNASDSARVIFTAITLTGFLVLPTFIHVVFPNITSCTSI